MDSKTLVFILFYVCAFAPVLLFADDFNVPETNREYPPPSLSRSENQPASPESKPAHNEFGWELDPYYTNISYTIPLTDDPVPEVTGKNEFAIYRQLFHNSLFPRFVLLEAAVFPMPLLGVATNKYTPEFYRSFNLGSRDLNVLEAVTAGFQEPYALSIFFGNLVNFVKPGEEKIYANKGYMGYLLSYSNQHIKRNILIPDNNLELEWKLKGDRVFKTDKLSWSFRVGAKIHENPDISDTVYLGIRRNNFDFSADILSIFDNSSIDFRWDFSVRDGRPLRQEYTIGKKIPISGWHLGMRLDLGIIWEDPTIYSGKLRDTNDRNFVAIIRPNIEF
jgi:hypothetical protein